MGFLLTCRCLLEMMFCCQGSVCSRLRHDLAGDPSPTRNPAHEAQAGWLEREREIGQRMATRVHCSTSHQVQPSFIQSDGCRPFQPQFKLGRRGFNSFVEAQGDSCSRSCCSWWWVPMLRKLEIMGTGCLGGGCLVPPHSATAANSSVSSSL